MDHPHVSAAAWQSQSYDHGEEDEEEAKEEEEEEEDEELEKEEDEEADQAEPCSAVIHDHPQELIRAAAADLAVSGSREAAAAIRIQSAFRGYLVNPFIHSFNYVV
jgi:TATA-binding protein-associated factor Taf7